MAKKRKSKHYHNVWQAVRKLLREQEYPPNIREIGDEAGIDSTSLIAYQLRKLEEDGLIKREPRVHRSIRLA